MLFDALSDFLNLSNIYSDAGPFASVNKNIAVKPVKCFLNAGEGGSEVHAYMTWTFKHTPILPCNADIPARFQYIVERFACSGAVFGQIKKQHIGALRHGKLAITEPAVSVSFSLT